MPETRAITPSTYARRLGVGIHKILGWIERGELAAINVGNGVKRRKRGAILPEAIADFERRRAATPKTPAPKRRRLSHQVPNYFV